MSHFTEDLAITLSLIIAGQTYKIVAGDIQLLELELHCYGFNGEISFVIFTEKNTDKLFTPITTQNDLIELTLQVESFVKGSDTDATPLTLKGLVTTRSLSEQTLTEDLPSQALMVSRHYHLTFADPAQVLWKQHYPCDLFVDASLKTLITAHTSPKINLTCDWPVLDTVHPVLSLSLGAEGSRTHFYDFLLWLVDSQNGVFSYDCGSNQYKLSASKSSEGTAKSLDAFEIGKFRVDFPEVRRHQPNVLNSYSESASISAITNADMASLIRRDYLASYPITADKQARVTLETARFKQRLHEIWIEYQKFQLQVTTPNQKVDFKNSPAWNASLFVQDKTYRVREWRLRANWTKQGSTPSYACYELEHNLRLEHSDELWVALPSYALPVYPFFVEGKIVSEVGADNEATYQFYTDANSSLHYYYSKIPLWDNKKVRTAYQPNLDTGQFYFPPYKDARVVIGLNFDQAFIAHFLDWEEGAALPQESLGNHLVMGKTTTDRNTLKHSYVDSKPQLQIQRTKDKDIELMQFSDGYIILSTQLEEGS